MTSMEKIAMPGAAGREKVTPLKAHNILEETDQTKKKITVCSNFVSGFQFHRRKIFLGSVREIFT